MFVRLLLSLGTLCCPPSLPFERSQSSKEPGACLYHFEWLQGDVVEAFRLVVGVDFLQLAVEYLAELAERRRLFGELYEPLVAALRLAVHEDGCCGVFLHLGAGVLAGVGESFLGVVLYEFLAEGVDEVLWCVR